MKKTLIAAAFAMVASTASALDVTVGANRDLDAKRNGAGISVGKSVGGFGVSAGVDRFNYVRGDVDLYSITVGRELVKVMGVSIAAQTGLAYNRSQIGANGWAIQPGLSFTVPVTKQIAVVTDVRRQFGESKVKYMNGNALSVGLKVLF